MAVTWAGIAAVVDGVLLTVQMREPRGSMSIEDDEHDDICSFGVADPVRRIWRPALVRVDLQGRITSDGPWSTWRPPPGADRPVRTPFDGALRALEGPK